MQKEKGHSPKVVIQVSDVLKFILVVGGYLAAMFVGVVCVAVLSTVITHRIFHVSKKTHRTIKEMIPKWFNGLIDEE